jgi:hypothetical protein
MGVGNYSSEARFVRPFRFYITAYAPARGANHVLPQRSDQHRSAEHIDHHEDQRSLEHWFLRFGAAGN